MTSLLVVFLRFLFFAQRSPFQVNFLAPFRSCHLGLIIPISNMVWHHISHGQSTLQVTESEKNHVSGSPLIYASVALLPCSLIICFFSWWARTCWFIVYIGVLQKLVERGLLLGQMQFKYWIHQPRLFILLWKSYPPTFRKRKLLSLAWVSIPFISCLFYCLTLFLIFNNGTFFGVAYTSIFITLKIQPRLLETRL